MYHEPVLLRESIDGLLVKEGGVYVDATHGGGGHTAEILNRLGNGKLLAFDTDEDALKNRADDERLIMVNQNFRYIKNYLEYFGLIPVDGIFADLGLSSHQVDTPRRGFSFRFDSPLDMRMNQASEKSAVQVINQYTADKLIDIFRIFGEIKNAPYLANAIVSERKKQEINSTSQLTAIIRGISGGQLNYQYCAQVFQAIRIEVNEELESLKALLQQSADVIRTGGRLVVISYHSLEDRIVKNFIRSGNFSGVMEKDFFGNPVVRFRSLTNKPVSPGEEEIARNNRARSARLRIAEKVDESINPVNHGR